MWDLTEAQAQRKRSKKSGAEQQQAPGSGEQKDVIVVKYQFASTIETSHRRPASDLVWLKPGTEVLSPLPD